MKSLNIESQREELEHIGWRKMALELRKKLPHLKGRKRSKLLLQPSAVTGVRTNRLTYRRLYATIAIISLAMNVWVMSVTLPGYKAKAARVDVLKEKIKLANITINDTAKDNAWLKGSYKKQVDKAIGNMEKAEKLYLKAEKDYRELFSQATK